MTTPTFRIGFHGWMEVWYLDKYLNKVKRPKKEIIIAKELELN